MWDALGILFLTAYSRTADLKVLESLAVPPQCTLQGSSGQMLGIRYPELLGVYDFQNT